MSDKIELPQYYDEFIEKILELPKIDQAKFLAKLTGELVKDEI